MGYGLGGEMRQEREGTKPDKPENLSRPAGVLVPRPPAPTAAPGAKEWRLKPLCSCDPVCEDFGGEGGVREIEARDLVRRALRNVRPRRYPKCPRWAAVSDAFGLGSTYSIELCRNFDLNPHEEIGGGPEAGSEL